MHLWKFTSFQMGGQHHPALNKLCYSIASTPLLH